MGIVISVMFFISIIILVTGMQQLNRKPNAFGIVFLFLFNLLILGVACRFLYTFVYTFFRGNNITISSFKTRETSIQGF